MFHSRFLFLAGILPIALLMLPPAVHADELVLKNGERFTGTVLGASPDLNVQFQTPLGVSYVPWSNIESMTRAGQAVPLAHKSGLAVSTSNNPSSETSAALIEQPGLWGAKWSGRANAGASVQSGNTDKTTINLDASAKAKWIKHRATAKAEYNRAKDEGTLTEDNKSLDLAYDYFFSDKWFWNSKLGFEQDEISAVDLRTNVGMGLGHQLFERDDLNLQYILGLSYLHEKFKAAPTQDSLAYNWSLDYDQKLFDDVLQIFHNHELLVPSDDTEDFLFESKTGARVPIAEILTATAEIDFDWDNKPLVGNTEEDTTYALKLGYEW